MFKRFKRRGQVLVFYALMIPLLFLFAGVGLDLGWYYLNVSRLQNAADAAALAGARTIIDSNSGKLKDLVPVLVSKLPEDNGLTDDGEPKVETSNSTETTTSETETAEGTTITYTETTTTTTTTISKTQLTDLNWTDGDTTAKNYIIKNIGTTQNVQADTDETANVILDSWSLFKSDSDRQVVPDLKLVKVNGDFYYIVKLGENIRHFFMPGWFKGMGAGVVAIAKLVPLDQKEVVINTYTKTWEEFIAAVRKIINQNVIIGNWEIQDRYKSMEPAYKRDENGNYVDANGNIVTKDKDKVVVYATDINGDYILDADGNKMQDYTNVYAKSINYTERFDANIYDSAWNHFQDFFNTFRATGYHEPNPNDYSMEIAGDFYRREIITVRDDVDFSSDKPYGANSSVAATSASINKKPGHVNNPVHNNTRKTYAKYKDKNGTIKDITDTGNVGLPYKWEYLDSINVDFKPEVTLPDKWIGKDWDVSLEDNEGVTFNHTNWTKPGQSGNVVITDAYIKHMRIHANINFDAPYQERSDLTTPYTEALREKDAEGNLLPDILWGRIESEPMLFRPDAINGKESYVYTETSYQTGLSSVRQIIINVNSSNYNTGSVTYRPVILFYDGPERYNTDDPLRESKPVILNLGKSFRGVLFAPNSPVVVVGNAQNQFQGFVVAKKYMRLKEDKDFIHGGYRYFNSKDKQWEYFRSVDANGKITYRDVDGNLKDNRNDSNTYKVAYYYAKGDNSGTKYYRTVENETIIDNGEEKETDNALVLYTDEYGEVQFAEVDGTFKYKIGEYDNFGRTDFTAQQYHIAQTSADNLLLSGK